MNGTTGWMTAACLALGLALTGCTAESTDTSAEPPAVTADTLPASLFATAAPEGAQRITEAKASAAIGDEVTLRGRVGGSYDPFVGGRAVMTVADSESILACDEREDDPCQAPWDFCCEAPEDITAASMTLQVVGADGRPLRADLNGAGGLVPGSFIVAHGKVSQKADGGVFVVDADSIHVVE